MQPITRQIRKQKREAAEERQQRYDALSLKDKIALAKSRRGNSKKELERLRALYTAAGGKS